MGQWYPIYCGSCLVAAPSCECGYCRYVETAPPEKQAPPTALQLAHRVAMLFKNNHPHFDGRCDDCRHLHELALQVLNAETRWCCAACRFPMLSTGWLKCPGCKVQLR